MSVKPETIFKQKILSRLREIGPCYWEKIQQVSKRGTPDLIGCVAGHYVSLELKTDAGSPSALQLYKLKRTRDAGGYAGIVTPSNIEEALIEIGLLALRGSSDKRR